LKPRVLIADDHTLVLEGIRRLLETEFDLIGTVEDGRAALKSVEELSPDVVLLDISMPMLNGLDTARQLRSLRPEIKIIFVTMHSEADYVSEAFRAGASGYVLKRSAASELVKAIHDVVKGRVYITPLIAANAGSVIELLRGARAPLPELTTRQREVLQLVAEGKAGKEIAAILKISVKTVEYHKSALMNQLGARTSAELTKHAIRLGVIAPVLPG
jgi:DNA-binding NarL/FixJ family response regulator